VNSEGGSILVYTAVSENSEGVYDFEQQFCGSNMKLMIVNFFVKTKQDIFTLTLQSTKTHLPKQIPLPSTTSGLATQAYRRDTLES